MMEKDKDLFARATRVIPGGVNSPVRAFNGVGGDPLFIMGGKGARIFAADGRTLTDWCCSWGAMILGHADARIVAAISDQASKGTTFGIATVNEVLFAERLTALVPGVEKVRAVSSGTEAVMTAVRLARGVTGRNVIVKFDGCYHGHSDAMLVKSGSGVLTMGASSSAGVPAGAVQDTVVLPYNDVAAVEAFFAAHGKDVAAVFVEAVAGNMGLVPPVPGFLRALRDITRKAHALLVCDEVITGFRFAFGTYSTKIEAVEPDLVTLGKVIGGGLPLAAIGGKAEFMDQLAPTGSVYQAGTLAGNPLAVAAGLATLEALEKDQPYAAMAAKAKLLADGVNQIAAEKGVPIQCVQKGGVFTIFATRHAIIDLATAKTSDTALYAKIFWGLYARNQYIAPSQFEVNFVSAAHTNSDVDAFLTAFEEGLGNL